MPADRPTIRRSLIAIAVLAALLACATGSINDQIKSKTNQLHGVNSQISQAQTQLGKVVAEDLSLKSKIAALDRQLAQVDAEVTQETARLQRLTNQLNAAKAELAVKEAILQEHINEFGRQMRYMYKTDDANPLDMILSAGNFNDLLNRIFFFGDIMRQDRREVALLRTERDAVLAVEQQIAATEAQQAQVVAKIKQQQAQLQAAQAQVQDLEVQVAAIEAQLQRQLQQMEQQRAALQAQLAQLNAEASGIYATGHFVWPIDGVITQGFGCTPYVFEIYDPNCPSLHFHTGLDIATAYGTPVAASDGGILHDESMWCGSELCGYGQYVVIVHGNGVDSLYGHLSGFAVRDGTPVLQGQVIGYEGTTGNSTGPHVHFEIDVNGSPVNPLNYLP